MKRTILCARLAAMLLLTGCHRHEAAAPAACFAAAAITLSRAAETYSANFATVGPPS